jgi:hypothetical protein
LAENLFGRDTELPLIKLRFTREKAKIKPLIMKFLAQADRGKNGIKNYRDDHHEFRDFW